MACDKGVLHGEKHPASTVSWRSFKVPRVCRSSLAAECQACATALEELMMVKTFLQVLKKPQKSLKELKDQLDGEDCAMVTDCKALFDAIHRETIQQATDKRVAIEGLVIKDLLHDLRCQWRWVSSERQLSDGLTKIGARQSFVERYKGSHVQLVADHAFTAAKKKSKEQRAQTVAETRSSTRSEVANTLIAMVMATCVQESHGAKDRQEDGSWLGFDGALMVTALIGLLTMLWFFFEAVNRCCRQTKAKEVELEDEEEIPREKTWPASRKKNKMPESQDDEEDIIYLCKKHPAVKEVYDQVEYLRSELMRANEKVRTLHRELHQKRYGEKPEMKLETLFFTPQGECWHKSPKCAGPKAQGRRICLNCVH